MSSLTLPAGTPAVLSVADVYRTHREPFYTVALSGAGDVADVESIDITYSANASIKGRGSLKVLDTGQGIDWENARLALTYHLNADVSWPLSAFVASMPEAAYSKGERTWEVDVADLGLNLKRKKTPRTYKVAEGTYVHEALRTLLANAGETISAITESSEVVAEDRVWTAGTEYIEIARALCDAANYFALTVNPEGRFEAKPYVLAALRGTAFEFLDGEASIHSNTFKVAQDLSEVPQQVIAVAQTSDSTAPIVGYYPDAGEYDYSLTVDTDSTSQEAADGYAARVFYAKQPSPRTLSITHLPVPIYVNDVVRFRSSSAGIDGRFVVTQTKPPNKATGKQATTLREVL